MIYLFREGMSAESMVESYPALTLEQVHGALAFYLGDQKEIDAYLVEGPRAAESQHGQSRQTNGDLITASDAGLAGLGDPEVLQIAADSGRILVSRDRRTMPAHFARFSAGAQSPGVILLREATPISTANRRAYSDLECQRS